MLYFENRKLKKDLLEADRRIEILEMRKADLERDIRKQEMKRADARKDAEREKKKVAKLEKELAEKDAIIREQTAADLLVNALQALGVVPPKKESAPDAASYFDQQNRLMQQMANAGRQQGSVGDSRNLGGLGGYY